MAKVERIIELLETRIARGDYALTAFPPEIRLAEELGVSRMTARRAILHLVELGLLRRDTSGRLSVTHERLDSRPLHIGFLTPVLAAASVGWLQPVEVAVQMHGGHVRTLTFFHWDDPVLLEAIESFDGVFLIPPAEAMPEDLAAKLRQGRARLVVLDADYSDLGIRSLDLVPPFSIRGLLDHLASLGHKKISVFNTQPVDAVIAHRLKQWQLWRCEQVLEGEFVNEPEPSYGQPMARAYNVAKERLSSGIGFGASAVLCLTMPAAMGLMRAMQEHGLVPGRDISVCCANDEGLARYLSPSLTSAQMAAPETFVRQCVDWMAGGEWTGPLLQRPLNVEIFVGGSTGSPPIASAADLIAAPKVRQATHETSALGSM